MKKRRKRKINVSTGGQVYAIQEFGERKVRLGTEWQVPGAGPDGPGGQRWLSVEDHVTGRVFGMETKAVHLWEFLGRGKYLVFL